MAVPSQAEKSLRDLYDSDLGLLANASTRRACSELMNTIQGFMNNQGPTCDAESHTLYQSGLIRCQYFVQFKQVTVQGGQQVDRVFWDGHIKAPRPMALLGSKRQVDFDCWM